LKPRDTSKDISELAEAISLNVMYILFTLEENAIHQYSKPADPAQCQTLFGLDLPLTSLVGIAGKRKKLLTCTQETTRAKLERLCSVRLILHDQ
jgi:hypothetical protein